MIKTTLFSSSLKEVSKSKQLKTEIIKESLKLIGKKDTLFLSSRRVFSVCGNEFDYEDDFSFFTRTQEIKNVLENPYVYVFNSWKENKDSLYAINEKMVVFGYIESDNFYSKKKTINLRIDSLQDKNKLYEINFASIKKDTVMIDVIDSYHYYDTEKHQKNKILEISSYEHIISD